MPRPPKRDKHPNSVASPHPLPELCFEGESLDHLLEAFSSEIESARSTDTALPEKFWFKQQFSMGVNEVTRVLERMPPVAATPNDDSVQAVPPQTQLQAILLASDCNPWGLTKHLSSLAASRRVPLLFVKDKKRGSLRLGEVVKLKTAIAVGVKVRGNAINKLVSSLLLQMPT
ncbi:unnamed protein product [Cuscuta epithymum]|uniref:Ribosomal protein eL8/eL30/eS12/Gadd45 domain-containing protein n=1 Tax=Cuscuta epithymum TaxID=186058 RepID=A0AAV0FXJ1_9ASTE|nr:unnamed protein product [Cuscuta epithymum]